MKKVENIEELTPVEREEKAKKHWDLIAIGSLMSTVAIIIGYGLYNYGIQAIDKQKQIDLGKNNSQSDTTEYSYTAPIGYVLNEDKAVKLDYYINNPDYEFITTDVIAQTFFTAPMGFVLSGDKCEKSFAVSTDTTIEDVKKEYPESEGFLVVQDGSRYIVTCEAKKETIYTAPEGFTITNYNGEMIAYKIVEKSVLTKTLK